ncbi:MAG: hypothetical protein IAE65_09455 [Ignavibacteria bacterium]|nr:hypothetical protein [Ignavibacteria bacterium]
MKFIQILSFFALFLFNSAFSQTLNEQQVFKLDFEGNADAYNLIIDSATGKYVYLYYMQDNNKNFLISSFGSSEQYDFINLNDTKFDSKGNFFTTAGNYNSDYGIDNNFILINGKNSANFEYIDTYSAYFENDKYTFIFKEFGFYKIGQIDVTGNMTRSESYDLIKPIYAPYIYYPPGDMNFSNESFYKDKQGRRGYIVLKNGKAGFMFGDNITMTEYSDINESSIDNTTDGQLIYIAKKSGKFYDYSTPNTGDYVVVGNTEYKNFNQINTPVLVDYRNIPHYSVTDSISPNVYESYLIIGNDKQEFSVNGSNEKIIGVNGYFYDQRFDESGNFRFSVSNYIYKPGNEMTENQYGYDYITYDGNRNTLTELGINTGQFKVAPTGGYIYSSVIKSSLPNLNRKFEILNINNGTVSPVLTGENNFILDYGYSPAGNFYFIEDLYNPEDSRTYYGSSMGMELSYLGKTYKGSNIQYNSDGGSQGYVIFNNAGDFAYVDNVLVDTVNYAVSAQLFVNGVKQPFPTMVSTTKKGYDYINNLFYTNSGKLFYVGNLNSGEMYDYTANMEPVYDNVTLGKIYNNISIVNYDKSKNVISFLASKGKDIYRVTFTP